MNIDIEREVLKKLFNDIVDEENLLMEKLSSVKQKKREVSCNPLMHVYGDMDDAILKVCEFLVNLSAEDCTTTPVSAKNKYTQEFIVDGQYYVGILKVAYEHYDTYSCISAYDFDFVTKKEVEGKK